MFGYNQYCTWHCCVVEYRSCEIGHLHGCLTQCQLSSLLLHAEVILTTTNVPLSKESKFTIQQYIYMSIFYCTMYQCWVHVQYAWVYYIQYIYIYILCVYVCVCVCVCVCIYIYAFQVFISQYINMENNSIFLLYNNKKAKVTKKFSWDIPIVNYSEVYLWAYGPSVTNQLSYRGWGNKPS